MIVLGIDVGINGGAAGYDPERRLIVGARDIPTFQIGERKRIDVIELCSWISKIKATHAVIELVNPMPSIPDQHGKRRSMGATSAFNFGLAAGGIDSACIGMGLPIRWVHPTVWKKHYGLKGGGSAVKEEGRQLAISKFPKSADLFQRVKDHNRAEAALIAAWFCESAR